MARKTKKKVPRGGQEISSFLQGHTTWKADTIQNIIAVGRFGNLADVVLLFRADLIVPWIHKDRAAAVIVAAHLNLSWVDEDPFLTLQAADMAAGMMHGDEVKIVCAEVQEKRPPMKSPSLQSQYVQQYVQLSRAAEQNSGEEPAPDDSQNNRLTDTKRYYARRTGKTYKQMIQDDRSQPGNAEHPAPEEIIQDDRSQAGRTIAAAEHYGGDLTAPPQWFRVAVQSLLDRQGEIAVTMDPTLEIQDEIAVARDPAPEDIQDEIAEAPDPGEREEAEELRTPA